MKNILKWFRKEKFSLSSLRHIEIGEQNGPAQGLSHPAVAPERCPYAPNFEGGSQEETQIAEMSRVAP